MKLPLRRILVHLVLYSTRGNYPLPGGADVGKLQIKRLGWVVDTSTSSVEIQKAEESATGARNDEQRTER